MSDEVNPALDRLFGKISSDQFFGEGELHVAPFPSAGGLKNRQPYDMDIVRSAIRQNPPALVDVDPRTLSATQSHVTKGGVQFYEGDTYDRTGTTYADQSRESNRFPIVYSRDNPLTGNTDNVIIAGHHRATAALLAGKPLRALNPRGGFGPES